MSLAGRQRRRADGDACRAYRAAFVRQALFRRLRRYEPERPQMSAMPRADAR